MDFRSILIKSSGATTRITARNQIIRIPATRKRRDEDFVWADISGLTLDPSRFFLVGRYTADGKPHSLLFFLSNAAASNAVPLLIVGFSDDGTPSKVFERNFEMRAFEQSSDGARITGTESISQAVCSPADPKAPSAATYDPYSIFLIRPGQKPEYQLEESRDYNRKHYVWAGPRSREDYAVVSNLPGHPKLYAVPTTKLEKLLAGVKCTP